MRRLLTLKRWLIFRFQRSQLDFQTYPDPRQVNGFRGWWIKPNLPISPRNVVAFMREDYTPKFDW
jgi:hypothetical protein